jgi:acetyl-CoA synthetase
MCTRTVRTLMRFDAAPIKEYDLSSLRILGTVGEPINPEAWWWYYQNVGHEKCTVVDTYWQTETGTVCAQSIIQTTIVWHVRYSKLL